MSLAIVGKVFTATALIAVLLNSASAQVHAQSNQPKTAVLHATVTVTGGVNFTGSYDTRLTIQTCAEVAKIGTRRPDSTGSSFYVPIPAPPPGGSYGTVGGGHTFSTDAAAFHYHGPGTYTGSGLNATQLDADTPPNSEETHIFAFPTEIGTLTVNSDASGSFQFHDLQDPGSVKVSGQVTWTCREMPIGN
jgi:hypothetical protein